MGLKAPLMRLAQEPGGRPSWVYNPTFRVLSRGSRDFMNGVVSSGSCFTIIHPVSGICWVFDAENGHLKKISPLYADVMGRLDDISVIETVILAWQVDESGRILMATRSEDAVFGARKITESVLGALEFPKPPASASPEDMAASRAEFELFQPKFTQALKAGFTAFPLLQWWSFDPETGDYEPAVPPEGAPDSLKELSDLGLVLEPLPGGGKRVVKPALSNESKSSEPDQDPAAKGMEQPPKTKAR